MNKKKRKGKKLNLKIPSNPYPLGIWADITDIQPMMEEGIKQNDIYTGVRLIKFKFKMEDA